MTVEAVTTYRWSREVSTAAPGDVLAVPGADLTVDVTVLFAG